MTFDQLTSMRNFAVKFLGANLSAITLLALGACGGQQGTVLSTGQSDPDGGSVEGSMVQDAASSDSFAAKIRPPGTPVVSYRYSFAHRNGSNANQSNANQHVFTGLTPTAAQMNDLAIGGYWYNLCINTFNAQRTDTCFHKVNAFIASVAPADRRFTVTRLDSTAAKCFNVTVKDAVNFDGLDKNTMYLKYSLQKGTRKAGTACRTSSAPECFTWARAPEPDAYLALRDQANQKYELCVEDEGYAGQKLRIVLSPVLMAIKDSSANGIYHSTYMPFMAPPTNLTGFVADFRSPVSKGPFTEAIFDYAVGNESQRPEFVIQSIGKGPSDNHGTKLSFSAAQNVKSVEAALNAEGELQIPDVFISLNGNAKGYIINNNAANRAWSQDLSKIHKCTLTGNFFDSQKRLLSSVSLGTDDGDCAPGAPQNRKFTFAPVDVQDLSTRGRTSDSLEIVMSCVSPRINFNRAATASPPLVRVDRVEVKISNYNAVLFPPAPAP